MAEVFVASSKFAVTSCVYLACNQCGRWCGPLNPFSIFSGRRMRLTGVTCSDCDGGTVMWSGVPDDGSNEAPYAE